LLHALLALHLGFGSIHRFFLAELVETEVRRMTRKGSDSRELRDEEFINFQSNAA